MSAATDLMGPLDIEPTAAMYKSILARPKFVDGGYRIYGSEVVFSDAATAFIRDNDLDEFTIQHGEDGFFITAPDEHAATLFRLAF